MSAQRLGNLLWIHTLALGIGGLLFFLLPKESATFWPWPLPQLAARFLGSLFVGGAVCSLVLARARDDRGWFVLVLLAAGDLLIALIGLLALPDIGLTPAMLGFLLFFAGLAVLLALTVLPAIRVAVDHTGTPTPRALRAFFLVHLLLVLPVGVSMYCQPSWAQSLWPWTMSPTNVRLIGSFFFGAAFISIWASRQRFREELQPTLALYAVFATLATIASLIHLNLFDPARIATWAFFALYVSVATGSWVFWLRFAMSGRHADPRSAREGTIWR